MKAVVLALAALCGSWLLVAQTAPKSVTVPVTLDHNRIIIDVRLPLPDGSTVRVRAWVDPGNADLDITDALAGKLGLKPLTGRPSAAEKERLVKPPPSLQIGGMAISLASAKAAHAVNAESIAPGCSAEINLPSTVLRNYDVAFDYPNRQFTIGVPGTVAFKGTTSRAQINPAGLVQMASKIEGQSYNLALDPGSSISLISGDLIAKWHQAQPAWPFLAGAVGAANMWGLDDELHIQVLRIPAVQFGATELKAVAAALFPPDRLEWFADRAGLPTIGLIGASALRNYRVAIDYVHSTVYLEQLGNASGPDMDVVGLTLRPEADERYTILGVVPLEGKPSVPDVKAGDVLIGIDGAPVTGATMGQVWSLLGGAPGQVRKLVLERDGKRFTVEATVHRFLDPGGKH